MQRIRIAFISEEKEKWKSVQINNDALKGKIEPTCTGRPISYRKCILKITHLPNTDRLNYSTDLLTYKHTFDIKLLIFRSSCFCNLLLLDIFSLFYKQFFAI